MLFNLLFLCCFVRNAQEEGSDNMHGDNALRRTQIIEDMCNAIVVASHVGGGGVAQPNLSIIQRNSFKCCSLRSCSEKCQQ